jgi:hypothetical protein
MADGPLTIRLEPSPALLVSILCAHLAAGLALILMRLPLVVTLALLLLVVVSALLSTRAQARKRGLSFVLAADGALRISWRDGSDAWASVLPGTTIFPSVLWFALAWTAPDGRQRRLRLMLIAVEVMQENGTNDPWRRLRTWLRHRALDHSEPENEEEHEQA